MEADRAATSDPPPWHARESGDALTRLESRHTGLSDQEAAQRLDRFGPNRLKRAPPVSAWRILRDQFASVVVVLLAAAALLSLLLGDHAEAVAIAAVLVLNTAIGFATELRARRAMDALLHVDVPQAAVVRNGHLRLVAVIAIVPGDVVELSAGQTVPADARLVSTTELRAIEAALTGESLPISKHADVVLDPHTPLAERTNMVYKGTTVAAGMAHAVVTATGLMTELGQVSTLVAGVHEERTPLERRLDALGHRLVWLALGVAGIVAGLEAYQGAALSLVVKTAIALAVAAVPEALPAVATIALAVGLRRMARRHALVRRLPSVEALGSTTVICSDKTRTLTSGDMSVVRVWTAGAEFRVGDEGASSTDPRLRHALDVAALASRRQAAQEETGRAAAGDPVDAAMLAASARCEPAKGSAVDIPPLTGSGVVGLAALRAAGPLYVSERWAKPAKPVQNSRREPYSGPEARLGTTRSLVGLVPFSTERKLMAAFYDVNDTIVAHVKGAPHRILDVSDRVLTSQGDEPMDAVSREHVLSINARFARDGLRVLALAAGPVPDASESALTRLTFIGLVGLMDPPAPGVKATIARLREAGLRTIMLTGDQRLTALAIGHELGLLTTEEQVIDGRELARLSADDLRARLAHIGAFSRVTPQDKLAIVEAFQARGEIVAMLGDGINDAAALKRADVGVAMGVRGTDVAKEAAAIVLQDDRFETVAAAVEQGRVIFDNIRKFVFYLFSCNLAEVLVLLIAGLAALPAPLLPLQILWLNMVTDTLPALALAIEPADPHVMRRPPRNPREALLSRAFLSSIAFYAGLITISTMAAFVWALFNRSPAQATTISFMTLALAQIFHLGNARSSQTVLHPARAAANPLAIAAVAATVALQIASVEVEPLRDLLSLTDLGTTDWAVVFGAGAAPGLIGQATKLSRRPVVDQLVPGRSS